MGVWRQFHRIPWPLRWPLKALFLAASVTLVLYPRFWLIPTWLERLRNPELCIDPQHAGLAPLEAEVNRRLGLPATAPASEQFAALLPIVEAVVNHRLPYAWDWDTWGVFDHVPTVGEALAAGREDCDGRAVLAASLLRRLGVAATLVSDLRHVWVRTPVGETMSPGAGPPTLVAAQPGEPARVRMNADALLNVSRGVTYGIAVFPKTRVLLIWLALCATLAHPWSSPARRVVGSLLVLLAVGLLIDAGPSSDGLAAHPWVAGAGWVTALVGLTLLVVRGGAKRPRTSAPESPAADGAHPG